MANKKKKFSLPFPLSLFSKKLAKTDNQIKDEEPLLISSTKRRIKAILMLLVAIIFVCSFFNLAGSAGRIIFKIFDLLIGKSVFAIPLLFIITSVLFLNPKHKGKLLPIFLGIFILIFGVSGILGTQNSVQKQGGWVGFLVAKAFLHLFDFFIANLIFLAIVVIGLFIFFQFLLQEKTAGEKEERAPIFSSMGKKIEGLRLKLKEARPKAENVSPRPQINKMGENNKTKEKPQTEKGKYKLPLIDLLEKDEGSPVSGDIKQNSTVIKRTLENFGIPVDVAEVNIGPAVTQYAIKPAEGVKLSRITTLSNNLSLALAAHPIRIEAPIPGKSLVGIEVPNKVRSYVRLRNLIADPLFQKNPSLLAFCLGRDVSGGSMYADLTDMPHLLVAGSTGTGKTIFLNSLILSLLYRSTPEDVKLILIDPKRVEFMVYNDLPQLLCPVIHDPHKAVYALQWLIKEMVRRFELFSTVPARDISTYNKMKSVISVGATVPYIILIVDELADLMAAKGREMEAGIIRLAQMARATGIHLVLATQRPSVEVITGLIKANITSRVTFQVASQVDSRTVMDTAGAEKLLGRGDMLFISAKSPRPKRIQSPYISEKEVKKVVEFIKEEQTEEESYSVISQSLKDFIDKPEEKTETFYEGEDPLYEEAKRVVIEAKKASASLLQRRLRVGYARAARLIDILEEQGVVGPGEGAKPREIYYQEGENDKNQESNDNNENGNSDDSDWEKV